MSKTKNELESEYMTVKADIRAHITMIKAYTESIQTNRLKLDVLSKTLTDLQQEYIDAGYGEGEKDEPSKESTEDTDTTS